MYRTKKWSTLAKDVGYEAVEADRREEAKVAAARTIAVLLHWHLVDGTSFEWGYEKMA
jgi:hypothetical protein